jgi:hypothetical protein
MQDVSRVGKTLSFLLSFRPSFNPSLPSSLHAPPTYRHGHRLVPSQARACPSSVVSRGTRSRRCQLLVIGRDKGMRSSYQQGKEKGRGAHAVDTTAAATA